MGADEENLVFHTKSEIVCVADKLNAVFSLNDCFNDSRRLRGPGDALRTAGFRVHARAYGFHSAGRAHLDAVPVLWSIEPAPPLPLPMRI